VDNRLKQRLVGAVVLVSLVAILVPMILDGQKEHGTVIVKTNIPPKPDHQFNSKVIPLDDEPARPEQEPARRVIETPSPPARAKPASTPRSAAALPAKTPPAEAAPAAAPRSGVDLVEKSAPAGAPPAATADRSAVRKSATESGKAPLAEASGLRTGIDAWVVQVGSFSSEKNALALRDRLRGKGYRAFVERLEAGEGVVFRVRVGPELDPSRANEILGKLEKDAKLKGIVVHYP